MIRLFKWIGRVFTGWYNVITKKETEESKRRYFICMKCDEKLKIGKDTYICSKCGCFLKAKCSSPEEKCLMSKW